MTQAAEKNQIVLDINWDYEINEGYSKKTGFFFFERGHDAIKVGFISDEHGNIKSLEVIEAVDGDEEPIEFEITDSIFKVMRDQIEPMLWDEEEYQPYDTMRSLGFTNSDFLYG